MTWNIQSHANPAYSVTRIRDVIRNQDPLAAFLQEVRHDRYLELRDSLNAAGWKASNGITYAFFRGLHTVAGQAFGNAVVSRTRLQNCPLPPFALPAYGEPRCVLRVDLPYYGLRVLDTQISPGCQESGVWQPAAVERHADAVGQSGVDENGAPLTYRRVIVGDFNYGPTNPHLIERADMTVPPETLAFDHTYVETGTPALTFPASAPTTRVDYIFARDGATITSPVVPGTTASDHRPLLAEVT